MGTNNVLTVPPTLGGTTQEILKPGKTLVQQIGGGEAHALAISLTQDHFVEITVEQRGAILMATLFDPQDREVIEMDFPGGGFGPIFLSAIAPTSGSYKLEIRSVNHWALPKNYDVTITSLRTATNADEPLIKAQQAFSQGGKHFRSGRFSDAVEAYKNSLAYWQSAGDLHWQAVTQYALSSAYGNRDREAREQCLKETLRLLDLQMAPNVWRLKASALNDLGLIYESSGETENALASLNAALHLYAAHEDRRGQASALGNLGQSHFNSGNFLLARELVAQALDHRRAENDKPGASNMVNAFAVITDRLGEPEQGLAFATQALREWEEAGELRPDDRPRVAAVLNNIAAANDKLGQWDQALEFYDKALAKYDERDPRRSATLDNKGELYAALGDPVKARKCYDEALEILAAAGRPDLNFKAGILVHIGQLFFGEGDLANALTYFEQARALPPRPPRLADVYTNIGMTYALKGELDKATAAYEEALKIQVRLNDRRGQALTLQKRGEARARLGKTNDAVDDFNRALAFWRAVKDRPGEASTLNDIARVERTLGNFETALARSAGGIKVIESLRTGISNRQLRASYFAAQENYYDLDIDLKMQLGLKEGRAEYLAAALESAERSRARVLLDTLNEAGLSRGEFNRNANPQIAKLVAERASVLTRLSAKAQALTNALNGVANPQQIAAFDREIGLLNETLETLEVRIRTLSPRLANLTKPEPATLKQIQEQLDSNTVLVEYFLGEARSYAWLVTNASIDGFELPPRSQIEALAERVSQALSARGAAKKNESWAERNARVAKAESDFAGAAALLSQMVLDQIGPQIGQKTLAIVADGGLQSLPFAVLPVPLSAPVNKAQQKNAAAVTTNPPLLLSNEIISLPSASVLVLQRRELAGRKPAPLAVAVLADPVFETRDLRVLATQKNRRTAPTPASLAQTSDSQATSVHNSLQTRALSDIGLGESEGIRRLLFSREEGRAILGLIKPNQSFKAFDFDASRSTAMSPELSKYRIVHFATHGVVNLTHPELSGILFSMVDERGRPENGYLGLHDIYNLNLPADLVVLSACETGIGKQIRGEGLIALTRGFMHAGAERVVASLWKVDDQATAELMELFYKEMLVNKLKPAAALRAAQLKLSQKSAWRKPHFWAGFVLQGEWR